MSFPAAAPLGYRTDAAAHSVVPLGCGPWVWWLFLSLIPVIRRTVMVLARMGLHQRAAGPVP